MEGQQYDTGAVIPKAGEETIADFDEQTALQFKEAYLQARKTKTGSDRFVFRGHDYLVDYAKYALQYLQIKFNVLSDKERSHSRS